MIHCVLHHNNEHRMDWYRMDEFMIGDHVEPYPLDLWNWGMQNRVGHLRTMAQDIVRLNLLPTKEASITRNGILFQGLHYTCDLALREQWFVRARERGSRRIPVVYDPRQLNMIYLRLDNGRRLETCCLHDSDKTFRGNDWQDTLEQIVGPAQEQAKNSRGGQTKRSRLKGIKENRGRERAMERQAGAWQLTQEESRLEPVIQPSGTEQHAAYVPPPRPTDKLRSLRQEKLTHER
jgi:hypothetical protein